MFYYKTIWYHKNEYDPIIMYSEIDKQRFETKRLEIFRTGEVAFFDSRTPLELSETPFPTNFDEINSTNEFFVSEISLEDFENKLRMYDTENLIEKYISQGV